MEVENVDAIVEGVQSEPSEIPMSAPAAQAQAPAPDEFEFTALGKPIKAPREKVLQWASQGYDYSQKISEFNKQKSDFETNYKTYQDIDRYAQENPEWWNNIQTQYSQRSQEQKPAEQGGSPEFQKLNEEIQELRKFRDEFVAEKSSKQRAEEDAQLKTEIESIRKSYPNLDFSGVSEDGKSLEQKVLEHGVQNGIRSFKTSFRDFYHEELVKRANEEGKEMAAKEMQKRTKLGLLGESSTPKKGIRPAEQIKSKSYDDLYAEALEELGLGGTSLRR